MIWQKRATWLLATYACAMLVARMVPSFLPYVAETDWKQWVWEYHRYHLPGAFPAGHVVTDYTFLCQPPLYWAAMASLSTVFPPVDAAILLNVIAFAGALLALAWAVSSRTSPLFGAAAAALLARDDSFHLVTWGGYPRTFGPTLVLLFLALWLRARHRLVLLVLILEAAIYPSVVVPCGLAYGAWSVLLAGKVGWLRRNMELAVTGAAVAVLGLLQNIQAPDWWGPVVTLAEAKDMPALGPHGRFQWFPLDPFFGRVLTYLTQPFGKSGLGAQFFPWPSLWVASMFLAVMVAAVVVCVRKKVKVPLEPFLLMAAALVAFVAARELAFKLYLPRRVVQHTLPYAVYVAFVIVVVNAAKALWPNASTHVGPSAKATKVALGVVLAVFVLCGDGMRVTALKSYARDQELYEWIDANTAVTAQLAGNLQPLDEIPLFSRRQVFVNWKMAHPIRKGYYAEMERRILAMYSAYYANDLDAVVKFADAEKIDYLVIDKTRFDDVEKGDGQLFEPVRSTVKRMFDERKDHGFALHPPPAEAVVFHHRVYDVIDVRKLRDLKP